MAQWLSHHVGCSDPIVECLDSSHGAIQDSSFLLIHTPGSSRFKSTGLCHSQGRLRLNSSPLALAESSKRLQRILIFHTENKSILFICLLVCLFEDFWEIPPWLNGIHVLRHRRSDFPRTTGQGQVKPKEAKHYGFREFYSRKSLRMRKGDTIY